MYVYNELSYHTLVLEMLTYMHDVRLFRNYEKERHFELRRVKTNNQLLIHYTCMLHHICEYHIKSTHYVSFRI